MLRCKSCLKVIGSVWIMFGYVGRISEFNFKPLQFYSVCLWGIGSCCMQRLLVMYKQNLNAKMQMLKCWPDKVDKFVFYFAFWLGPLQTCATHSLDRCANIVRYPWSRGKLTNVQNQLDKWGSWLRIAWALDKRIKCRCGSNVENKLWQWTRGRRRTPALSSLILHNPNRALARSLLSIKRWQHDELDSPPVVVNHFSKWAKFSN